MAYTIKFWPNLSKSLEETKRLLVLRDLLNVELIDCVELELDFLPSLKRNC